MKKKNIKIVQKRYDLAKKLQNLKQKLEEDVQDGKILANVTAGLAITTIVALLTSIITSIVMGSLPSIIGIIAFGITGFTLIEGLLSLIFCGLGWSEKIFNAIKNKIVNSKIKSIEKELSKLNTQIQDADFETVLRKEIEQHKLEEEIKFQEREVVRKKQLIKKLTYKKQQEKKEKLMQLQEQNKKLDNEIKSLSEDEISVQL